MIASPLHVILRQVKCVHFRVRVVINVCGGTDHHSRTEDHPGGHVHNSEGAINGAATPAEQHVLERTPGPTGPLGRVRLWHVHQSFYECLLADLAAQAGLGLDANLRYIKTASIVRQPPHQY